MNKEPTYSNIYGGLRGEDRFFADIPYYCDYLYTFAKLLEFPTSSMLDVGCGHGAYEQYISSRWGDEAPEYLGIDLDRDLIDSIVGGPFKCSSLMGFKSRKKYDIVLCHSVLQYVEDLDGAVRKLRSLVRKTGFVSVFQTMSREDYQRYQEKWDDPYAIKRTKKTYKRAFLKEFDIVGYGVLTPKGQQKASAYGADEIFIEE